jgi:Zn-dependent protease
MEPDDPRDLRRLLEKPPDERDPLRPPEPERDYKPIHPEPAWRQTLRKLWAPVAGIAAAIAKLAPFIFKGKFFFSIFITIGVYALFWGWTFGIGIFALIVVHELGHVLEAKRQGVPVLSATFLPLIAFVRHQQPKSAYHGALIALAGPALSGAMSGVFWWIGEANNSNFWKALAYVGFFINLLNLLPFSFLDGARVADVVNPLLLLVGFLALAAIAWRSHNYFLVVIMLIVAYSLWQRARAQPQLREQPYFHVEDWQPNVIITLYGALVALLILGLVATTVPRPQ